MYEWLRDGAPISGATGSSYLLTQDDVGRSVSVKVTYSDMLGTGESVSSGAVGPVANVNDPHPIHRAKTVSKVQFRQGPPAYVACPPAPVRDLLQFSEALKS
jgi:hypothetical protein